MKNHVLYFSNFFIGFSSQKMYQPTAARSPAAQRTAPTSCPTSSATSRACPSSSPRRTPSTRPSARAAWASSVRCSPRGRTAPWATPSRWTRSPTSSTARRSTAPQPSRPASSGAFRGEGWRFSGELPVLQNQVGSNPDDSDRFLSFQTSFSILLSPHEAF